MVKFCKADPKRDFAWVVQSYFLTARFAQDAKYGKEKYYFHQLSFLPNMIAIVMFNAWWNKGEVV